MSELVKLIAKKMNSGLLRKPVALMCLCVPVLCVLFLLNLSLPEVSLAYRRKGSYRYRKGLEERGLGELGDMVVVMLPDDLAFTIFVPSKEAFEHVLKLRASDSLTKQRINDTYAILSRVMGFSAVPQHLPAEAIPMRKEISFDSISGFRLFAWKDLDGTLVVNNIRSELVDVRKAETIVHILKGVIMDAEFEQSFQSDYED